MATLIPSISTCVSRMTSGEKRVAQRLEDKLDDDYLLWYDVPMGPKNAIDALERDPQLVQPNGPHAGKLLVLYDDARSIYERARSKQFSFKSVGIQAQGRTTILKINYRNTKQVGGDGQIGMRFSE